jgi:hypothetical protein
VTLIALALAFAFFLDVSGEASWGLMYFGVIVPRDRRVLSASLGTRDVYGYFRLTLGLYFLLGLFWAASMLCTYRCKCPDCLYPPAFPFARNSYCIPATVLVGSVAGLVLARDLGYSLRFGDGFSRLGIHSPLLNTRKKVFRKLCRLTLVSLVFRPRVLRNAILATGRKYFITFLVFHPRQTADSPAFNVLNAHKRRNPPLHARSYPVLSTEERLNSPDIYRRD